MRSIPPGCLSLLVLGTVLLPPFLLANAFLTALAKLGLGPTSSVLAVLGIFLGSTINIPVATIERPERVAYRPNRLLGLNRLLSCPVQRRAYTTIAVNVGGCLVPTALAVGTPSPERSIHRLIGHRFCEAPIPLGPVEPRYGSHSARTC
jgi:uncharacterized membrane protein